MKKLESKKLIFIAIGIIAAVFIFIFAYCKTMLNKPNIILITVDALRADHLSCYGYERNTSPNIDRLAKEGVVFLNCFATSTSTAFTTPGLLTGRYLAIDVSSISSGVNLNNVLDGKFTTLAEYLKYFGYFTVAFLNNPQYREGTGFEQGFDYFRNYREIDLNAKQMTDYILNFLTNYRNNKPFFIWVHYIDPHSPYVHREEFLKAFKDDNLWRENDKELKVTPKNIKGPKDFTPNGLSPKSVVQENQYNVNYYIACYDAEILYTDYHIGRLLKNIKDDTLIILTADHGESLGEHNSYFQHGGDLIDALLHIPLIIKDTRFFKGGRKILEAVVSIDIVPTILSKVDPIWYLFNKRKFDGRDLKRIVYGKDLRRKYIYSYIPGSFCIRDVKRNFKYILYEQLYFLPDEHNNLVDGEVSPKIFSIREGLKDDLMMWLEDYPVRCDINPKEITFDEELVDMLRSLGYLQ